MINQLFDSWDLRLGDWTPGALGRLDAWTPGDCDWDCDRTPIYLYTVSIKDDIYIWIHVTDDLVQCNCAEVTTSLVFLHGPVLHYTGFVGFEVKLLYTV